MASYSRQDRALMRQRGAGSRAVSTADFGINFGLGDSRLERQQMRQRGAGSRKIDNVDFGISFPTPAQRTHTKTPQPRRSTSRQPSNTPTRHRQSSTSTRTTRRYSSRLNSAQPSAPAPEPQSLEINDEHGETSTRSSKKRKLSPAVVTPTPQSLPEIVKPTPTRRASKRTSSIRTFTIAEDNDVQVSHSISQAEAHPQTSPLFVPQPKHEKENKTPNTNTPKPNREDSGLQTTKSGRILLALSAEEEDIDESASEALLVEADDTRQQLLHDDKPLDLDKHGSSKQQKRKKRRSLTLKRKRRRSSTHSQAVDASKEQSPAVTSETPDEETPLPRAKLLADRITKYSKLGSKRNMRAATTTSDREQTPDKGEEDDDSYIEQSSPEVEMPAASTKGKRKTRRQSSRESPAEISKGDKTVTTFPILTHRLTGFSILPTIHEDDEAPVGDALQASDRAQPNVVDVLAQICRETISNAIDRIAEVTQSNKRTSLNNKRSALEAFGKDLDDELFAMSEAVENRFNLEGRVRKSKREKAALRAEYIELRREREQVALKCDALRRRHWQCEESTRAKWTLSEAAMGVEQEMDRNSDVEDEGIEFLIRDVTTSISNVSGQGILDRVVSFNAQLENMALLLERRNG
ncbi:hypothetical protein Z517_03784 [Fonsecaea pedrosoi CBS 271.37]|uniref:Unplaced genomic scaffold supercont1.2, whole genome shotgun sequence n=1 Tax=Fonsecaea pedrosoi CBS 271.37 TaxID=1442368 RepID=A0A0D2HJD2_9EURO|nr:uncharacterized protein Z517_03784 [Fonsecaea pedrosoi CBS 271.37]KIW84534.1 hypothetical protein Z517_03784 [Fonsecaea pedrosoi CBS 271.37]